MLNIVEPVPPTEPIPSNSRNSVYHFQYNSGIPGISSYQSLGILGIPSDFGIEWSSCHPHPHTLAIASNSWTEFRQLSRTGIGRNPVKFLPIPESDGIMVRDNSGIPGIGRIDSGIRRNSGLTQFRNSRNWFLGRNWFRNGQHCEIGWLLKSKLKRPNPNRSPNLDYKFKPEPKSNPNLISNPNPIMSNSNRLGLLHP
jgi:hypothetical protein